MQIYLLFLILISVLIIGRYITTSTKKIVLLLESIYQLLKVKDIGITENTQKVKDVQSDINSYNDLNKSNLQAHTKGYTYEELFEDEEVFFVQEIQLDAGDNIIGLDISTPEDK